MRKSRFRKTNTSQKVYGEINMSPLLDLTFLLLVSFIIAFPALQSGITVKLPTAKADALQSEDPITITLRSDGALFISNTQVSEEELAREVAEKMKANPKAAAQIRADETQSYGRIMDIIKILRKANLTKFSLVTESE